MPSNDQNAEGQDTPVDIGINVGQRPDGTHWVSMTITTMGIASYCIVLPPAVAKNLAPQLAKELINAAEGAEDADRKHHGLAVVHSLPDSLRK